MFDLRRGTPFASPFTDRLQKAGKSAKRVFTQMAGLLRVLPPGSRVSLSLARDLAAVTPRLLELDLRASLFELGLELVGFVLVHAFLDVLRSAFDEVLGFL